MTRLLFLLLAPLRAEQDQLRVPKNERLLERCDGYVDHNNDGLKVRASLLGPLPDSPMPGCTWSVGEGKHRIAFWDGHHDEAHYKLLIEQFVSILASDTEAASICNELDIGFDFNVMHLRQQGWNDWITELTGDPRTDAKAYFLNDVRVPRLWLHPEYGVDARKEGLTVPTRSHLAVNVFLGQLASKGQELLVDFVAHDTKIWPSSYSHTAGVDSRVQAKAFMAAKIWSSIPVGPSFPENTADQPLKGAVDINSYVLGDELPDGGLTVSSLHNRVKRDHPSVSGGKFEPILIWPGQAAPHLGHLNWADEFRRSVKGPASLVARARDIVRRSPFPKGNDLLAAKTIMTGLFDEVRYANMNTRFVLPAQPTAEQVWGHIHGRGSFFARHLGAAADAVEVHGHRGLAAELRYAAEERALALANDAKELVLTRPAEMASAHGAFALELAFGRLLEMQGVEPGIGLS